MRRRLRRARRMRETLMTELGALVMEMHRQGRHDPALVDRKAREALVADREAAGLARALGAGEGIREVVAAGIVGGCHVCGALLATDDRFCARCGAPTPPARNGAAAVAPPQAAVAQPSAAHAAPPPDPRTQVPAPVLPPDPPQRVTAAPPHPATRAPEPGAAPPPPPRSDAPPPPDPSTRVPSASGDADTGRIPTATPRER